MNQSSRSRPSSNSITSCSHNIKRPNMYDVFYIPILEPKSVEVLLFTYLLDSEPKEKGNQFNTYEGYVFGTNYVLHNGGHCGAQHKHSFAQQWRVTITTRAWLSASHACATSIALQGYKYCVRQSCLGIRSDGHTATPPPPLLNRAPLFSLARESTTIFFYPLLSYLWFITNHKFYSVFFYLPI